MEITNEAQIDLSLKKKEKKEKEKKEEANNPIIGACPDCGAAIRKDQGDDCTLCGRPCQVKKKVLPVLLLSLIILYSLKTASLLPFF